MAEIKPTRMELLNTKKKIQLAQKGHKLLKEKRDALFNEFFAAINRAQELRREMDNVLVEAHRSLAVAQAETGSNNVHQFALVSSSNADIDVEGGEKNIMGVRTPTLGEANVKRNLVQRGYSLLGSSSSVDDAAQQFEDALDKVLKLAEAETLLFRLANEIEKTKRKVNALEYIVIPRLKATKKYIAFRLEEMERDKFFVLKKVKKKIEARAAA